MLRIIFILLSIQVLISQEVFDGYTLFSPLTEGPLGGGENYSRLIDNNGNIINQWDHDYSGAMAPYLMPDSTLICPFKIDNPYMTGSAYGGKLIRYVWDGDILWEYDYSDTNHLQHHDIEPLSNGNILIVSWDRKTYLEVLASGRQDVEGEMWPDKIVEIQPISSDSAEIVWEWKFWDHLIQDADPDLPNYGVIANHPELIDINIGQMIMLPMGIADWNHINSIDYNEELDQIILSSRNMSEIYIIDHSTTTEEAAGHTGGNSGMGGDFLYRWGNPMNYGRGNPEDQILIGQHDANWIESGYPGEGNIIIFNNGALSGFGGGFLSSIFEIVPPVTNDGEYEIIGLNEFGPSTPIWSYSSDFFSNIMSGARRLPNGNTFITVATALRLIEVGYNGDVFWEYIHDEPGQPTISKAFKYSLDYFDLSTEIQGDLNNDYNVDLLDIIIIINFILEIESPDEDQINQGDINGDGLFDIFDIMLVIDIILN